MTYYFLTATKEFLGADNKWHTTANPTYTRDNSSVTFSPNNGQMPLVINPATDIVNIDGTANAAGTFTPATLVSQLQAVFPKANTSSGGSGLNGTGYVKQSGTSASYVPAIPDSDISSAGTWNGVNTRTALFLGSMTKSQRDAIGSPVVGSQIFNSTDGYHEYYDSFWGWMPLYVSNEWKRKYGWEYFKDFFSGAGDGYLSQVTANSGIVNSNQAPGGATAESSGVASLSLATATNARAGFISGSGSVVLGSGITVYEARVQFPVLSNSTDRYAFIAGLYDTVVGIDQVDGAYLLYDEGGASAGSTASGNWQIVTSSNSVRTFTASSSAIAANTWYNLRIEVNAAGTLATFYVNGTSVGSITTNIPTGLTRAVGFGMMGWKSVGTTTRNILVNYIAIKQKYSISR